MSFEVAKNKAIKYVGISRKTEQEVYRKLKTQGFDENIIMEVIEYLKELGYINDNDYVDAYIRQCMRLLDYSTYEIRQKLLQKGINKYIIDDKVGTLEESDYNDLLLNKLLNGKCKNMDDLKKKQYLFRRGLKYFED